MAAKKNGSVQRERKGLVVRANGRSADWIMPSFAVGCGLVCAYCVEEGTQIKTSLGLVPVEQIQDGAEVLAYDSSLEQLVSARVYQTASREVDAILEIQVGSQVLRVTEEHPLYTRRGWVKAGDLSEDDEVLCDESYTE